MTTSGNEIPITGMNGSTVLWPIWQGRKSKETHAEDKEEKAKKQIPHIPIQKLLSIKPFLYFLNLFSRSSRYSSSEASKISYSSSVMKPSSDPSHSYSSPLTVRDSASVALSSPATD